MRLSTPTLHDPGRLPPYLDAACSRAAALVVRATRLVIASRVTRAPVRPRSRQRLRQRSRLRSGYRTFVGSSCDSPALRARRCVQIGLCHPLPFRLRVPASRRLHTRSRFLVQGTRAGMRIERFTTPAPLRRTFGAFRTWEACYSSLPPFSGGATRPKTEPLTSLSPPRVRRSAMICRTVRARPPRLHSPRARERRAARAIRDAFHRTAIVSSSRRESIRPDRCHRSHDFAAVARCCDACSLPAVSPDAFAPMLYRESLCPRPRDRCPSF